MRPDLPDSSSATCLAGLEILTVTSPYAQDPETKKKMERETHSI